MAPFAATIELFRIVKERFFARFANSICSQGQILDRLSFSASIWDWAFYVTINISREEKWSYWICGYIYRKLDSDYHRSSASLIRRCGTGKFGVGFWRFALLRLFPPIYPNGGFNFGQSVFGTSKFEVVHFAFEFYNFQTFNALVNLNNLRAQTVLRWSSGEYSSLRSAQAAVTAFKTETMAFFKKPEDSDCLSPFWQFWISPEYFCDDLLRNTLE